MTTATRIVKVRGCRTCPCLNGDWQVGLHCALDKRVRFTESLRVRKDGAQCPLKRRFVLLRREGEA